MAAWLETCANLFPVFWSPAALRLWCLLCMPVTPLPRVSCLDLQLEFMSGCPGASPMSFAPGFLTLGHSDFL